MRKILARAAMDNATGLMEAKLGQPGRVQPGKYTQFVRSCSKRYVNK